MKTTTIRIPEGLHRAYKLWSVNSNISFNTLVLEALKEKLARDGPRSFNGTSIQKDESKGEND